MEDICEIFNEFFFVIVIFGFNVFWWVYYKDYVSFVFDRYFVGLKER